MVSISVIIPVYNVEEYLFECLNSVINQTFDDIEIICVNDGSTDNSLSILNEFASKDKRIKVISQTNKGVSIARNNALKIAKGKYIYFIDSDDVMKLNALTELFNIAEKYTLDLIMFKAMNFDNETKEKFTKTSFEQPYLKDFKNKVFNLDDIKENALRLNVTIYNKFFKRDLIKNIFFLEDCIFEDNLFFTECVFKSKRMYYYDKYLYCRRIRPNSLTSKPSKNHADVIRIHNEIIKKVKELGLYEDYKIELFNYKMAGIFKVFKNVTEEFKEFFFDLIKRDFIEKESEYKSELNFNKLNPRPKLIFFNAIKFDNYIEFEQSIEIYDLKKQINKYKNQNSKLTIDLNITRKNLKKVNKKNKELKDLNDSIINSKSWKLTKPLRKMKRIK